jgi:hypothetical protein
MFWGDWEDLLPKGGLFLARREKGRAPPGEASWAGAGAGPQPPPGSCCPFTLGRDVLSCERLRGP